MKKKPEKQKDLESLREKLAQNGTVFLTGYEKMTVQQDFELRKSVRAAGGSYKVIKNRIAEKAGEGSPAGDLLKDLKGMLAVAYTSGDPARRIRHLRSRPGWWKAASWIWRASQSCRRCRRRK